MDPATAVTRTALDLIAVPSMSGDESGAAKVFGELLTSLGAAVTVDGYGSVTGTWEFGPGPTILFDTHLDTVPVGDATAWTRDPAGELSDDVVYGRGAVDMKGPIAACLHGIGSLRDSHTRGRVVVSGSVAEELVEGPALLRVLDEVQPDAVVICEPSRGMVAVGQRGRAEVVVEAAGAPAHSAYPARGRNAAEAIVDLVAAVRGLEMPTHPWLGDGLLVLTGIASRPYPSLSVVPDGCVATFDRRTLPGESLVDVLDPIREHAERIGAARGIRFDISVAVDDVITYGGDRMVAQNFAPAWTTERDGDLVTAVVGELRQAGVPTSVSHYAFCTNGSGSAGVRGIPTIGYGPGREDNAHVVDEWISVADLVDGVAGYAAVTRALTGLAVEQLRATDVQFTSSREALSVQARGR